eukprot:tig00000350_g24337.t1
MAAPAEISIHPFDPSRTAAPPVPPGSVLILFDLSETLILRTENLIPRAPIEPELRWNKKKVYLRPGVRELLASLQAHPRCALAFYTSISAENARPVIEALCPPTDPATRVFALFDRNYSIRDPHGEKKWDTMRSLPRVWAAPVCQGRFDANNTILIDNTPRKVRNHMQNALIVPPWEKEQLVAGDDRALPALSAYFLAMLDAGANGDVRAYMSASPFPMDLSRTRRRTSSSSSSAAAGSHAAPLPAPRTAGAGHASTSSTGARRPSGSGAPHPAQPPTSRGGPPRRGRAGPLHGSLPPSDRAPRRPSGAGAGAAPPLPAAGGGSSGGAGAGARRPSRDREQAGAGAGAGAGEEALPGRLAGLVLQPR